MIERAIALQPRLRAEQDETERRGVLLRSSPSGISQGWILSLLAAATVWRLRIRRENLLPLGIELSRGDPSVGWCLIVGAGHALMLGSYFSEEAQAEGFGPTGEFSAPSVAAPNGTATPADGGWLVKGQWGYASGAPYATHFMPSVLITGENGPPRAGLALIPRSQWKMLDDWGAILGMRGSGSNSIVVEQARVAQEPRDRAGHAQRGRDERNAGRAAARKSDVRGALPFFLSRGARCDLGRRGLRGN